MSDPYTAERHLIDTVKHLTVENREDIVNFILELVEHEGWCPRKMIDSAECLCVRSDFLDTVDLQDNLEFAAELIELLRFHSS